MNLRATDPRLLPRPRWRWDLMWWSPWTITRPWWPRGFRGSDEWHNLSWGLTLPPFGAFIVFRMRYGRDDRYEHLNLWTRNEGWEGLYVIGCPVCADIYSGHPDGPYPAGSSGWSIDDLRALYRSLAGLETDRVGVDANGLPADSDPPAAAPTSMEDTT